MGPGIPPAGQLAASRGGRVCSRTGQQGGDQPPGADRAVRQNAVSDRKVTAIADQGDGIVRQADIRADVRIGLQKLRDQRGHLVKTKGLVATDAQQLANLSGTFPHPRLEPVDIRYYLLAACKVILPLAVCRSLHVDLTAEGRPSRPSIRATVLQTSEGDRRNIWASTEKLPPSTTFTKTSISDI